MNQGLQNGLLNDIFDVSIAPSKGTDEAREVRKMFRDGVGKDLLLGH